MTLDISLGASFLKQVSGILSQSSVSCSMKWGEALDHIFWPVNVQLAKESLLVRKEIV